MKFAYADPPYLGCAKLYAHDPRAVDCDDPEWYRALLEAVTRLTALAALNREGIT